MSEDKNLLITISPLERRCSLYKPYRWAVLFCVFQSAAFRTRKKTLPYRRISSCACNYFENSENVSINRSWLAF